METAPNSSFGDLLRYYRVSAKLSQEALAERAGLSVRAISDLERGARRAPYQETIRLLATALGLADAQRATLESTVRRGRGPRTIASASIGSSMATLPTVLTPLIGRDSVIEDILQRLRPGGVRLLTLTGPPGIGKTRLALAVATDPGGRWHGDATFVGLAPITDPGVVATSVLQALGLTDIGGRSTTERLKDVLRRTESLLVLDNFEQVVAAAALVGELLAACPGLTALVTSRVPLHLHGEYEFPVPPLALPSLANSGTDEGFMTTSINSPAVALFADRARATKPNFALTADNASTVVEICHHLEGIPLAIELAAARSKVLTPGAMLSRLEHRLDLLSGGPRDAPARHRTLREAIAWSHDLLSAEERVLFRRLGVFVGGWTLSAAERVCNDAGEPHLNVFDGIAALVDQSLVQQDEAVETEPRFSMLETLREFALEQLDSAHERPLMQRRHAAAMVILAEEAEPHLTTGDRGPWLERLSQEQDNIRAALNWTLGEADPELGLRLVGALWLWFQRRLLVEGRQWAEKILAHSAGSPSSAWRASALFAAGHFAWLQGDVRAMRAHFEEAVLVRRHLSDAAGLGRVLPFLGLAIDDRHDAARKLAEEGVALCRAVNDQWGLALALTNLGRITATWGDDTAARAPLEEATALFRVLKDRWLLALPLTSLGAIAYRAGNHEEAQAAFAEALSCFSAVDDRRNTTQVLTNLGYVTLARGQVEQARAIFSESFLFGREHGDRFNAPACLRGFAATLVAVGELDRAVRYFAVAEEASTATGSMRWPAERLGGPVAMDELRSRMDREVFETEWRIGRNMSLEKIAEEAFGNPGRASHRPIGSEERPRLSPSLLNQLGMGTAKTSPVSD